MNNKLYRKKSINKQNSTVNFEFFKFINDVNISIKGIDPKIREVIHKFCDNSGKVTPSKKRF